MHLPDMRHMRDHTEEVGAMIYRAEFDGEVRLPEDQRTQYFFNGPRPLPADGLPRITAEGIRILVEGLRGDFRRWRWGIGNHPLQMPYEHTRNLYITAMKDRPHFLAAFYYGDKYPQVKYIVMTPRYPFDMVDTYTNTEEESSTGIYLRQSADPWAYVSIQVGDANLWTDREKARFTKDAQSCEEEPAEDPEDIPSANGCTLDAWMEAEP